MDEADYFSNMLGRPANDASSARPDTRDPLDPQGDWASSNFYDNDVRTRAAGDAGDGLKWHRRRGTFPGEGKGYPRVTDSPSSEAVVMGVLPASAGTWSVAFDEPKVSHKFRMGTPAPMNKCRCIGSNKQQAVEAAVGSREPGSIKVLTKKA